MYIVFKGYNRLSIIELYTHEIKQFKLTFLWILS
jgi:hypothetical protein